MKNPQAFPCDSRDSADFAGMTLRDYFAAKAMQALLSDGDWRSDMLPKDTAHISYVVADAMLEAREQ